MPFVELETLPELTARLPLWSVKRWAPARFLRRDFLGAEEIPLADAVRQRILEETGCEQTGPIYLLANWRYFGYQNNPIAVYYCYDAPEDDWNMSLPRSPTLPGVNGTAMYCQPRPTMPLWQQSSIKHCTYRRLIP